MKSGFLHFFCTLNPLHVSISNTFHVCILLVLQPPFPVPSNTALSTPHFPWNLLMSSVFSLQVSPSPLVLTAPWFPLHFSPVFRSVTTVKSYLCINWQARCFWQRWTLLFFLWQDITKSLSSTQMSSLVRTGQGGAKNMVSVWERTIAQEHMMSVDQILASTFC